VGDEVAAAFGWTGMHDEFACDVIERAQYGDFLRVAGCRDTQIRPGLRPHAGEVGMRQRLALIAVEQHDVAGFGLLFAQLQAQADPLDLGGNLTSLQRVSWPPPAKLFCAAPWIMATD
jgi:hypothetical protein